MLLLTDASVSLTLPAGYTTNVLNGTPVTLPPWQTVGIKTVTNLRVGAPQVVEFNLPSTMLPPPSSLPGDSHYCLVAILHSPSNDVFASTVTERRRAQRSATGRSPRRTCISCSSSASPQASPRSASGHGSWSAAPTATTPLTSSSST